MIQTQHKSIQTKERSNSFFRFLAYSFGSPTRVMLVSWLLWLLAFILAPFHYTILPSIRIVSFILACIISFAIGDFSLKQSIVSKKVKQKDNPKTNEIIAVKRKKLNRFILFCGLSGIAGALLFALSKLFLSGLDFSQGVSGARIERANDVLSGFSGNTPVITYLGLILFPLGTVSFLVSLLKPNSINSRTILIARISALSPVAVTLVTGGRGGILQLIIMFFSVYLIRYYCDRSSSKANLMPKITNMKSLKKSNFKWFFVILVVFFVFYSFYIFNTRREIVQATDFYTSLDRWESYYGIFPAKYLETMVNLEILDSNIVLNLMQTFYYLTSGPSVFTKLVSTSITIGPYYGQYQVALLASFCRKFFPSLSVSDSIYSELNQAGTLGLIPSSWGMMYADFGWIGTLCEAFILGCLSSYIYYSAISKQRLGDQVLLTFTITSILLNPIIPPLGFSDTFFTFLIFLLCRPILNKYCSSKI